MIENLVPIMTVWREASGEGEAGMAAVASVILNRMHYRAQTAYKVCLAEWQFSSMTAPNDPGLLRWPDENDSSFQVAQAVWQACLSSAYRDPTHGSDLYYAVSIKEPAWAEKATFVTQIGKHRFYRENPELGQEKP